MECLTLPGEPREDRMGGWWEAGEERREKELGLTYEAGLFLI